MAIISIAQQASPKVTGQMEERRAQLTIFSTEVVRTGMSGSSDSRPICNDRRLRPLFLAPVERALAPDVDVAGKQERHEKDHLHKPRPAQLPQGHRPRIEEGDLDVEEQEDHRHEVE